MTRFIIQTYKIPTMNVFALTIEYFIWSGKIVPYISQVLSRLPSYLNMPNLEVTVEYREKFMQAINTFLYQLVFDPVNQTLRPLNDYPDNMGPDDYPYAGKFVGNERARQIALGNVNVQTGEVVDTFDPETYKVFVNVLLVQLFLHILWFSSAGHVFTLMALKK